MGDLEALLNKIKGLCHWLELSIMDDGIKGLWIWDTKEGRVLVELDDYGRVVEVSHHLRGLIEVDAEAAERWNALRHETWKATTVPGLLPNGELPEIEKDMAELTEPWEE